MQIEQSNLVMNEQPDEMSKGQPFACLQCLIKTMLSLTYGIHTIKILVVLNIRTGGKKLVYDTFCQ